MRRGKASARKIMRLGGKRDEQAPLRNEFHKSNTPRPVGGARRIVSSKETEPNAKETITKTKSERGAGKKNNNDAAFSIPPEEGREMCMWQHASKHHQREVIHSKCIVFEEGGWPGG